MNRSDSGGIMSKSSITKKAINVYKNQGVKGVLKKSKSTLRYRTRGLRRMLKMRRETLDEKALREEYGFVSNEIFQITSQTIADSKKAISGPAPKDIKSATWF